MSNIEQRKHGRRTQRQRTQKRRRLVGRTILLLILIVAICLVSYNIISNISKSTDSPRLDSNIINNIFNTPKFSVPSDLNINSANAILVDLEKGKTLFSKESEARVFPASITKVMTAIVVLENLDDLNEKVFLSEGIFYDTYASNAMVAGFLPNEEVRAIDLLYGLILPSGAECAIGLAERVSGSESAFAELMNEKAQKLGMEGSHFTNATGLHDENHYSTVKDLAVLLEYALKNDTFYEIFTTSRYSTGPTNMHGDGVTFYSTMFSEMDGAEFEGGSILGGKTGYTPQAGQCLASLAKKDDNLFILVTCGAYWEIETQRLHIDDAFTVYSAIQQEL
jgi:D-alanyl-D-alanine carboxypeptidase